MHISNYINLILARKRLEDDTGKTRKIQPFSYSFLQWQHPTTDFIPDEQIMRSPLAWFYSLSRSKQKIIRYLFHYRQSPSIYFSQERLCQKLRLSRGYLNRILAEFTKLKLIDKYTRYKESCLYRLSQFFKDSTVQKLLRPHIWALRALPLTALMASFSLKPLQELAKKNITLKKKDINTLSRDTRRKGEYLSREDFEVVSSSPLRKGEARQWLKREKKMNEAKSPQELQRLYPNRFYQDSPISAAVMGIKSLQLTFWGQLWLMMFDSSAILYADDMMQAQGHRDSFEKFCEFALAWHKGHNSEPDWEWLGQLALAYRMPANAPKIAGSLYRSTPSATPDTSLATQEELAPSLEGNALIAQGTAVTPIVAQEPQAQETINEKKYGVIHTIKATRDIFSRPETERRPPVVLATDKESVWNEPEYPEVLKCGWPVNGGSAIRMAFMRKNPHHSSVLCPFCKQYRNQDGI